MLRNIKILGLAVIVFIIGCKKNEEDNPDDIVIKKTLYLRTNHLFDGSEFAVNQAYSDDFGNKIEFTRADFYFSLPKIKDASGNKLSLDNDYYLIRNNTRQLKMIDSLWGKFTIDNISANIGVDSVTNHQDPSLYDTNHPLAFQSPSQHWGWTDGYLFVTIEGNVDTNDDDVLDDTFTFHIGMDKFLKSIQSETGLEKTIGESESAFITLNIDYKTMFSGIDLSTENSTHTMDNPTLATKFTNNFSTAFELK